MFDKNCNLKVAERIKKYRKAHKLTGVALANKLNMSVDTIYAYEEGSRTVPINVLLDLSKLFNVSIDELLGNIVTYNRQKAISFEVIRQNKKGRITIDSENDNVIFFEVDEWTLNYYVKCIDLPLNKDVLINENGNIYPGIISFDEKSNSYAVFNKLTSASQIYKYKKFKEIITTIGEYAGTVNKKLNIENFL